MSVATTMLITTPLLAVVAWKGWRYGKVLSIVFVAMLVIDAAFFTANASKITHGGWFSLLVGGAFFAMMTTWHGGRRVLQARLRETAMPADLFLEDVARSELPRVAGTAVFLSANPEGTPHALLHNIKHNKVLHERVIFLHAATAEVPYVPPEARSAVRPLGQGFFRVQLRFGFMEEPNVPAALDALRTGEFPIDASAASYFLGREKLIPTGRSGMSRWREVLFTQLADNAESATTYFRLPPNRVVEIGSQVEV
jgi:KUP system potassium uptake protein